jgi:hypothetical protein
MKTTKTDFIAFLFELVEPMLTEFEDYRIDGALKAAKEQHAATVAVLRSALAFIQEEAENRSEAGSEYSDYEREPRELAERLEAVIASTALSSADSAASSTASTCGR